MGIISRVADYCEKKTKGEMSGKYKDVAKVQLQQAFQLSSSINQK